METLLSPSNVLLYGRILRDMRIKFRDPPDGVKRKDGKYVAKKPNDVVKRKHKEKKRNGIPLEAAPQPPRMGDNKFLQKQLGAPGAKLARIYGFSFEGHYYDLAAPTVFLVHGPGRDPEAFRPSLGVPNARVSRAPADADRTGVAYTDSSFSEDMRVWSYDQADFSIRLNVESGTFEQLLLEAELSNMTSSYSSGSNVRGSNVRGSNVRGSNVRGGRGRGGGDLGD